MCKLDKSKIFEGLKDIISEKNIKENEPMKNHTSFKVGGPADFFVTINSTDELKKVLKFAKENDIKITIIGNGTNVLVSDDGIRGIVIKLNFTDIEIKPYIKEKSADINQKNAKTDDYKTQKIEVIAGAGVPLGVLGYKLQKEGVAGFEELTGIPGTIGGAVLMNAGAYGKEMKDVVTKITAIDYDGNTHIFSNEDAKFEYRNSIFTNGKYIILQAKMLLEKGKSDEIKAKIDEYTKSRKEKQPLEYPSAGSTFKRGDGFITAKLIDDAGLKGYKIGGAEISTKHAGFIINTGNATSEDILSLIKYTQEEIQKKFGKKIEPEIKILK